MWLAQSAEQANTRTQRISLLAMACSRDGSRWANRSVVLSGAGRFLLTAPGAAAISDHVFAVVCREWRRRFRQASDWRGPSWYRHGPTPSS